MLSSKCNNRGIGLIEVIIALFLTTVGVLAIISLQPAAWQTSTRSDYMGRAAGILLEELEAREVFIMNSCNTVTTGTFTRTIRTSGAASAQACDATFAVTTTITTIEANVWRVVVRVAWPGHSGIVESLLVTRQQRFQFGC